MLGKRGDFRPISTENLLTGESMPELACVAPLDQPSFVGHNLMNERRVVITGIGCLSPLGNDLASTWDGLKNGRSGIARITQLDLSPYDCKIGGEVKGFSADEYFNVAKDARRADRYVQFAVAAAKMAMQDSGVDVS